MRLSQFSICVFFIFRLTVLFSQEVSKFNYQVTDLSESDLAHLFTNVGDREDIFVLQLNNELTLHLQYRKCDKYYNGGEVKIFDVVNYVTSEFLLGKIGEKYFATFTKSGWHNYLVSYIDGNLVWMEEIWEDTGCGSNDKGFEVDEDALMQWSNERVETDFSDSLNIMLVFNQSGKRKVEQQLNIEGDTALMMWSNVAVSYMNMTLENSGVPGFCRLAAVDEVDFNVGSISQALNAISTFSGSLAPLKQIVQDNCIHITSFLTDHPGVGPSGQAVLFRENREALYSASIISFSTLCHELGHNLGFGHGPNADDSVGFSANCRGYSTAYDGINGENLSTLMDYVNRVFVFSNVVQPYTGEMEQHHGRILGNSGRNNAGSLQISYPILQRINSKRVFIDTMICEGSTLFGYTEAGLYKDTIADITSCSGVQIRTLNLKIIPAVESSFQQTSGILNFNFEEFMEEGEHKKSRVIGENLWVWSIFHIYKFSKIKESFEKIVSFPHPENGGTLEGLAEIILNINEIDGELYVESNKGVYKFNEMSVDWEPLNWNKLPEVSEETGTLIRISGDILLRSEDNGEHWEELNIPFEIGPQGILLHQLRYLNNYWFIQQYAPYHLYISKDDGRNWERSQTEFIAGIDHLFIKDDLFFIRPINAFDYYRSYDEGLNWEKDNLFKNEYQQVWYREYDETFFLQRGNSDLFALNSFDESVFYLTNLPVNISHLWDQYIVIINSTNNNVILINSDTPKPLKKHISICEGENYFGYTEPGNYIFRKSEEMQCDTIFRLELEVKSISSVPLDTVICSGEMFANYYNSGVYSDIFFNESGCDSLRVLHLTVLDSLITSFDIINDKGNGEGEIKLVNIMGGLSPYKYYWSDGTTEDKLSGLKAGNYNLVITDHHNCTYYFDFEVALESKVIETLSEHEIRISPNPVRVSSDVILSTKPNSFEKMRITDENGREIVGWKEQSSTIKAPSSAGIYLLQFLKKEEIVTIKLLVY